MLFIAALAIFIYPDALYCSPSTTSTGVGLAERHTSTVDPLMSYLKVFVPKHLTEVSLVTPVAKEK